MTTQFFDIETEALPRDQADQFAPEFKAPISWRDPEKIRQSVQEQEARWLADGALSALTGRVLCIGVLVGEKVVYYDMEDEATLLGLWWNDCATWIRRNDRIVGHFCKTFDLPFLVRRSWRHNIRVPYCLFDGRFFDPAFVDLAEKWACHSHDPRERISLDTLSRFLGVGSKNGRGEDFSKLWRTNQEAAFAYLKNDLELTRGAYERMVSQS